jgi:hypothetical protein
MSHSILLTTTVAYYCNNQADTGGWVLVQHIAGTYSNANDRLLGTTAWGTPKGPSGPSFGMAFATDKIITTDDPLIFFTWGTNSQLPESTTQTST